MLIRSEFPHISKIEDPSMSFADIERTQYTQIGNGSNYNKFSCLWNLNAFRRLKKREVSKNGNVVTRK